MQTQTTVNKYNTARVWLPTPWYHLLLLAMAGAIFFLSAVFPLRGLGYSDAPLPRVGSWILWPTHVFFPDHAVITSQPVSRRDTALPSFLALSWNESFFLFAAFLSVVLLYLLALSILPRYITYRYIIGSTLVLGVLYVLIPVVTSQDLFSYIGYARMEVIYHLNPLTAPPTAIRTDPVYSYIHWMVLAWLLYWALGSPWFWPWYTVTFFGLLVLIASVRVKNTQEPPFFTALRSPLTISLFTFSMLSLYCFFTLGPVSSAIPWLSPFRWTDLRGLWAWLIPPLLFCLGSKGNI